MYQPAQVLLTLITFNQLQERMVHQVVRVLPAGRRIDAAAEATAVLAGALQHDPAAAADGPQRATALDRLLRTRQQILYGR